MAFTRAYGGLTKRGVCAELRRIGWVRTKRGWEKKRGRQTFPSTQKTFSLREAASFEAILSCQDLS